MTADTKPGVPGVEADKPAEIPAAGWWQILRRAWAKADQVPLLAAGVAFFGVMPQSSRRRTASPRGAR